MERSRTIRLRTYAQVWRLERVIYQIEGVTLPVAVSIQQIAVFATAILVMAMVSRVIPGVSQLGAGLRYVGLPLLVTWFFTRHTLDGKSPHRWLWGMILFLVGAKRLNRFQPMEAGPRFRFRHYAEVSGKPPAATAGPAQSE